MINVDRRTDMTKLVGAFRDYAKAGIIVNSFVIFSVEALIILPVRRLTYTLFMLNEQNSAKSKCNGQCVRKFTSRKTE
jgi:hypothetical protein